MKRMQNFDGGLLWCAVEDRERKDIAEQERERCIQESGGVGCESKVVVDIGLSRENVCARDMYDRLC